MSDARISDLDRKDVASQSAAAWAERTHAFREGLAGACDPELRAHYAQASLVDGARIATTSDGIGTKVELAERTRVYDTLGFDLVAMVVDDLAAAGATPLVLTNVLDVDRIDPVVVDGLMRGLHDAARKARVAVTGGEIAELGTRVAGFGEGMHFNWCATAIGHYPPGRMPITGSAIRAGDVVVALASPGFRSNGFSLVRRVLEGTFGAGWHAEAAFGTTWGAYALTPSVIYAPVVTELAEVGAAVHGFAHVTGGGIANKLGRVLARGPFGANLTDPFEVAEPILELQRLGAIADFDAYRAWNMGQGFMIVCPEAEAARVFDVCARHGHLARIAGRIDDTRSIRVRSRGRDGGTLTYPMEPSR